MTLQERARGSFIGLAVGDALGGPTEGKTQEEIVLNWGRVLDFISAEQSGSDDTEYALFNAKLLLQHKEKLTSSTIAEAYRKDIIKAENTYKGAGFSEMIAIHNLLNKFQPPATGQHVHSWSDGVAMRVAPYGIASAGNPQFAAHLAKEDGVVTNSGEGIYGGQAVAAAISMAMLGVSLEEIIQAGMNVIPKDSWTFSSIQRAVKIGFDSTDIWSSLKPLYASIACTYYFWTDIAPEAVGLAFGILAAARGHIKDSILGAVNIGRDTDTIAAVTGAICGALHGIDAIPNEWKSHVLLSGGRCISAVKGMKILDTADELALLAQSWSKKS